MKEISRRKLLRTLGSGAILGTAAGAYPRSCAEWIAVERHELALQNWDAEGFKVVVLGDMHVNSEPETERAIHAIEMALEETCDLILIPGDFVNFAIPSILKNIGTALNVFERAKVPVVAVMGNHDYWSTGAPQVIAAIRETPVRLLRNELFEIDGVTIAGVDDGIERKDKYDFFPKGKVSKSLIGMLHEPDFVKNMPDHVSLQISGHSHGGQICLPFGIPIHTPFGARTYKTGFYDRGEKPPIYVNRGVGTTGPNYRMFCRPEISVLTLRSA